MLLFLLHKNTFLYQTHVNLTNDVGLAPMNIVMKLAAVKEPDLSWTPTIKLSDEKGKHSGDPTMIHLAKEILNIKD